MKKIEFKKEFSNFLLITGISLNPEQGGGRENCFGLESQKIVSYLSLSLMTILFVLFGSATISAEEYKYSFELIDVDQSFFIDKSVLKETTCIRVDLADSHLFSRDCSGTLSTQNIHITTKMVVKDAITGASTFYVGDNGLLDQNEDAVINSNEWVLEQQESEFSITTLNIEKSDF